MKMHHNGLLLISLLEAAIWPPQIIISSNDLSLLPNTVFFFSLFFIQLPSVDACLIFGIWDAYVFI